MKDHDYIVMVDENGKLYIEHIALKGVYSIAKGYAGSAYNKQKINLKN